MIPIAAKGGVAGLLGAVLLFCGRAGGTEPGGNAGSTAAVGSPFEIHPALDAFPLLDRLVKEYDIRLAIHNHGPGDLYPSPYDSLKAAQPYDRRIGVCYDVGHGYQAGADPVEAIHRCRERLYDVHLKDTLATAGQKADVPVVVGHGRIDFPGAVAALLAIKYPFRCGFEYEQDVPDRVTGLAESVGYIRGILAGLR